MPVASLQFTNLGPFDDIAFEFDPQVNVFIGPNNCGKTSALLVLADLLTFPSSLPRKLFRGEAHFSARFDTGSSEGGKVSGLLPLCGGIGEPLAATASRTPPQKTWARTGSPPLPEEMRDLPSTARALGYRTFVPALRLSTDFRSKGPGTSVARVGDTQEERVYSEAGVSWLADERIIQRLIDLDYRAYRDGNPAIRSVITQIGTLASQITDGFRIEFLRVAEDKVGLFPEFRTPDGRLPFNVLSQGTQSLIQWCAQLLIG